MPLIAFLTVIKEKVFIFYPWLVFVVEYHRYNAHLANIGPLGISNTDMPRLFAGY